MTFDVAPAILPVRYFEDWPGGEQRAAVQPTRKMSLPRDAEPMGIECWPSVRFYCSREAHEVRG
jgi:hypothetical protein